MNCDISLSVLPQLDPSLEAKVNVQKQGAILEEEYEVSRDRLSTLRQDEIKETYWCAASCAAKQHVISEGASRKF